MMDIGTWTPERIEQLSVLWDEGITTAEIGRRIGVTKNAVIGKVHRLSLSGRAKPTSTPANRPRKPSPVPVGRQSAPERMNGHAPLISGNNALKPQPDMAPEPRRIIRPAELADVVPISLRATILTLTEQTCKWPIGDPSTEEFHFCGHRSKSGVPYCEYHAGIAYQPVNDRRRDRKAIGG